MSIRAETNIKFSTYFSELPEPRVMKDAHERITDAIKAILEDMDIARSHIAVECPVGYELRMIYGTEDEEAFDLGQDDEPEGWGTEPSY